MLTPPVCIRWLYVQVCDLGLALPLSILRQDGRFAPCFGRRGTWGYLAPEVFAANNAAESKVGGQPSYGIILSFWPFEVVFTGVKIAPVILLSCCQLVLLCPNADNSCCDVLHRCCPIV